MYSNDDDQKRFDGVVGMLKLIVEAHYDGTNEGEEGRANDVLPSCVCINQLDEACCIAFDPQFMNDRTRFFNEVLPLAIREVEGTAVVAGFTSAAWQMTIDPVNPTMDQRAAMEGADMSRMEGRVEVVFINVADINGRAYGGVAEIERYVDGSGTLKEWTEKSEFMDGRVFDSLKKGLLSDDFSIAMGDVLFPILVEELGLDVEELQEKIRLAESREDLLAVQHEIRDIMEAIPPEKHLEIAKKLQAGLLIQANVTSN